MLITEDSIRDRFVVCLKEVLASGYTGKEVAIASHTSESYLSQLQKKSRKIPPSLIANFCLTYRYSPTWILTGKGSKKDEPVLSTEERLMNINASLTEIIRNLTKGST